MISRSESETSQRFPGKRKKLGAMYEVLTIKNQDIVAFSTFGVNYCGNFGEISNMCLGKYHHLTVQWNLP